MRRRKSWELFRHDGSDRRLARNCHVSYVVVWHAVAQQIAMGKGPPREWRTCRRAQARSWSVEAAVASAPSALVASRHTSSLPKVWWGILRRLLSTFLSSKLLARFLFSFTLTNSQTTGRQSWLLILGNPKESSRRPLVLRDNKLPTPEKLQSSTRRSFSIAKT